MCNLLKTINREEITIYKIVAKKKGNYYSTFTGQKYKIGKVNKPKKKYKRLSEYWNTLLESKKKFKNIILFKPRFYGKTSGFSIFDDALSLYRKMSQNRIKKGYQLVIVKMVLGGEIWLGEYDLKEVFAANTIKEINELKIEEYERSN